jgi:hypothetical protein
MEVTHLWGGAAFETQRQLRSPALTTAATAPVQLLLLLLLLGCCDRQHHQLVV